MPDHERIVAMRAIAFADLLHRPMIAALFIAGLVLPQLPAPASADPPDWAPAHGRRDKHHRDDEGVAAIQAPPAVLPPGVYVVPWPPPAMYLAPPPGVYVETPPPPLSAAPAPSPCGANGCQ
jgi:hypothetical protein